MHFLKSSSLINFCLKDIFSEVRVCNDIWNCNWLSDVYSTDIQLILQQLKNEVLNEKGLFLRNRTFFFVKKVHC